MNRVLGNPFKAFLFLFLFFGLASVTIAKPLHAAEPIKIGTIMSIT
jgi:hypothetical protein